MRPPRKRLWSEKGRGPGMEPGGPKGSVHSDPGKETEKKLQKGRKRAAEKKACVGSGVISEMAVRGDGIDGIAFHNILGEGRTRPHSPPCWRTCLKVHEEWTSSFLIFFNRGGDCGSLRFTDNQKKLKTTHFCLCIFLLWF